MKQTAIPRYQSIKAYLLDGIHQGTFRPGTKIPPELALSRQFAVSRMTVNKAIHELVEDGVLLRFAGDGTYVAEAQVEVPLLEGSNIAAEVRARAHGYRAEVVRLCRLEAAQTVALQLEAEPGQTVYYSLIVHYEDNVPVQLEERYVNPAWAPDYLAQDFTLTTPNAFLMQCCPLTGIEHMIRAVVPDARECELLQVEPHEPCLLILRRSRVHKSLVAYTRLLHPGSRYTLHSRVNLGT